MFVLGAAFALGYVLSQTISSVMKRVAKKNSTKFYYQLEEMCFHVISTYLMYTHASLTFDEKTLLYPILHPRSPVLSDVYHFYFLIWLYQLVTTYTKEKRYRAKFHDMLLVHHVITLLLLSVSYAYNLYEFGFVVIALHDTSDIFLDMTKLFNYAERTTMMKVSCFMLMVAWLSMRIGVFGYFLFEVDKMYIYKDDYVFTNQVINEIGLVVPFVALFVLHILYIMNAVWFVSIAKFSHRTWRMTKSKDIIRVAQDVYE